MRKHPVLFVLLAVCLRTQRQARPCGLLLVAYATASPYFVLPVEAT